MNLASSTIAINGVHGVFALIAAILFLIAAIISWFIPPRSYWPTFVAAGLMLWVLTVIVH